MTTSAQTRERRARGAVSTTHADCGAHRRGWRATREWLTDPHEWQAEWDLGELLELKLGKHGPKRLVDEGELDLRRVRVDLVVGKVVLQNVHRIPVHTLQRREERAVPKRGSHRIVVAEGATDAWGGGRQRRGSERSHGRGLPR
jgi:hypothetical protein